MQSIFENNVVCLNTEKVLEQAQPVTMSSLTVEGAHKYGK